METEFTRDQIDNVNMEVESRLKPETCCKEGKDTVGNLAVLIHMQHVKRSRFIPPFYEKVLEKFLWNFDPRMIHTLTTSHNHFLLPFS